jgi:hypothetical protein
MAGRGHVGSERLGPVAGDALGHVLGGGRGHSSHQPARGDEGSAPADATSPPQIAEVRQILRTTWASAEALIVGVRESTPGSYVDFVGSS